MEGFAKDNPIGPVSGGAGGPTTTITAGSTGANAALVAAVTVGTLTKIEFVTN